jgi:hypothetical protein
MILTLAIDDDVLAAAKELASRENKSVGEVISGLARRALISRNPILQFRNGVPLLPQRVRTDSVTPKLVKKLMDEEELN